MSRSRKRTGPESKRVKSVKPRPSQEALPIKELRQIQMRLKLICSTALVVQHAINVQNVLLDSDAADVLRCHVTDALFDQILRLKRIVGGGVL